MVFKRSWQEMQRWLSYLKRFVESIFPFVFNNQDQVVLTGGTDNMSACPYAVRDIRFQNFNTEFRFTCTFEGLEQGWVQIPS